MPFLSRLDQLFTPSRIRGYALLLVAAYVIAAVWWLGAMKHGVDADGKPIGYDFITFYAESMLDRAGRAAAAYDMAAITAAEKAIIAANQTICLWHYPPTFALLMKPLAYMPYLVALPVFVFGSLALYLLMVRQISDHPLALLLALALPAVFINGMHGQNGFLNTAVLGFGLLMLDRRPWLAGLLLGLLVYKPHFGVLLPLLLASQGRWKSFAGAAISATLFCAISLAVYGLEPWLAFVRNLSVVSQVLERRMLPWPKIPSVFVAVADLGVPQAVAYGVHIAVAVGLAGLTWRAWRLPGPQTLKVALAIPAILAVSPYCFDYDLVLLAIPIALVAEHARRAAVPTGTKAVLGLGFITPIAFTWIADKTHIHLMPVAILLFYAGLWRVLAQARGEELSVTQNLKSPGLAEPA